MDTNENAHAPRFLGAAFLGVVLTSLISGLLIMSATGSGTMSQILARVAENVTPSRFSVVVGMANSVGIVVLAALLYIVLRKESKVLAVVALGLWLGEAFFYAVGQMGVLGLIPVSQDFVRASTPDSSYFQALGELLYNGVYKLGGGTIHMFFYCAGGLAWYWLFYRSRLIPRAISGFGLAAVSLGLVGTLLALLGNDVGLLPYLPMLPFELTIGTWLLVRGTSESAASEASTANDYQPKAPEAAAPPV